MLTNDPWLPLEGKAALVLHRLEGGEGVEAAVGERLVGQRPEVLGGLEFGGVGREEEQMDALGATNRLAGMPPGAIQDQQDVLGGTGTDIPSKGGEDLGKEGRTHAGEHPPLGLPGARPDKATEVEPLVALLDRRDGALPDRGPDPTDERQEADPMFIGRPELDLSLRMGLPNRLHLGREIFF